MKSILLITCLAGSLCTMSAQESVSNRYMRPESPAAYPFMPNQILNEGRLPLYLPEIEGYTLLKCDFHLHTVFSDGSVWPTTRVEEAFREGLDAIAITDHFEFRFLNEKDVNARQNYNREYEIARSKAKELGVLLVPGLEITREVPPGHYNVLFIEDPSPLVKYINTDNPRDTANLVETLAAAKELGGFITWNHPPYQNPNGAEWKPMQQALYEKGLMMGIEIINSNMYVPLVHQWADEKGLTKMSNTDWHGSFRIRDGFHRAMTIVFAKERSVAGIKEALLKGKTVCYAYNYLYGKEELLKPVFEHSLKTRILQETDKQLALEIRNLSGLPYELDLVEDDFYIPAVQNKKILLYGNETTAILLTKKGKRNPPVKQVAVLVNNLHVLPQTPLKANLLFQK